MKSNPNTHIEIDLIIKSYHEKKKPLNKIHILSQDRRGSGSGDNSDGRDGRFRKQPRVTETPSTGSIGAVEQEELLYKFFAGDLNHYFKTINEQILFIKLLHADGIES